MKGGPHVAHLRFGKIGVGFGLFKRRKNVLPKARSVALADPGPALGFGDRDKNPGLPVAPARRESARFADLANQRRRDRIRAQAANRPGRAHGLKQRNVLAQVLDIEIAHP